MRKRKKMKKSEYNLRNLWDTISWSNIHIMRFQKGDVKEKEAKRKSEEVIIKNSPKFPERRESTNPSSSMNSK